LKWQIAEEMAECRRQQERLARELGDLAQQFRHLGGAQPSSEKKRRSRRRQIGDHEESVSLDGLLQPSNHPEEFEGAENQAMLPP
jgi:type II secretory pathway component HofQ